MKPSSWDQSRLEKILEQMRGKKILVVGDVGLDRYTIGSVERISPEAPVPVVLVEEEKLKLGLAANVADNICVLNGVPLLMGVIGQDQNAEIFKNLLISTGIESSYLVPDPSRRTILKERVVSEQQQLLRIDYESLHQVDLKIEAQVLNKINEICDQVDGVILEDYSKGTLTGTLIQSILTLFKKKGKIVAVDPNLSTPLEYYHGASILTPNTKEAEHLSQIFIRDEDSLRRAGFFILKSAEAQFVVITRGKEGMALFSYENSKNQCYENLTMKLIPTYARQVYDVSGAGDTVISVLVLSLVSGASLEEASILGNIAAGVEVGKRGTATVSPDEVRSYLNRLISMPTV